MALPIEMVHGTGLTTVEENNEWRFGEQTGGVVSVTIVPELFNVDDETLRNKYLTGVSHDHLHPFRYSARQDHERHQQGRLRPIRPEGYRWPSDRHRRPVGVRRRRERHLFRLAGR